MNKARMNAECNLDNGGFVIAVSGIFSVAWLDSEYSSLSQSINQSIKPWRPFWKNWCIEDHKICPALEAIWQQSNTLLVTNWLLLKLLAFGEMPVAYPHQQWLIRQFLIGSPSDNLKVIWWMMATNQPAKCYWWEVAQPTRPFNRDALLPEM
jgi:hypothetical protein